ncbi:MAG: GTP-binding protein [Candidatus Hermodarchaeota archaeon]
MLEKRNPRVDIYDTIFKVVFFGEDGVGTSSLLKGTTSDYIYDTKLTIGVDLWVKKKTKDLTLREKVLRIEERTVKLLILRLSNEKRFRAVLAKHLTAANGAIFMYDITNPTTVEKISEWTSIVRNVAGEIPIVLVGGKADLVESRQVSREEALQIKKLKGLDAFIECSSVTGENVEEVFKIISRLMVQHLLFH